ncbi:MAG: hypothetical protein KAV83_11055 [Desulfobacterales bacterium]|nr:hypothetical protein [Desulfobacterales bacterium]
MKRIAFFVTCVVLFLLILGCRDHEGRKQVINYLNNDILRIYELEESTLKWYTSVTGKNYTGDQALYEALKDRVIPTYSRFVNLLQQIHTSNDNLRRLHHIYVQSARSFQTGFGILLSAIEKKDPSLAQLANRYITEGRQKGERWQKEFSALCQKNGIKIVFKKGKSQPPG